MLITPALRALIAEKVDDLFFDLKASLLGRFFKGPSIFFEVAKDVDQTETLEGLYRHTIGLLFGPQAVNADIDNEMGHMAEITGNYLDASRLKLLNKVLVDVQAAPSAAEAAKAVRENLDKTTSYVNMLVANEARTVQAYANKDGIGRLGASIGIEDPIVCKLGFVDHKLCKNCKELWHTSGNLHVPKVYKLSELQDGYMKVKKGESPFPTHGPTHPNCRHTTTMVPPNFGFDSSGTIKFVSFGYDVYADQRKKGS
jgi:hypothetical protein